MIKCIFLIVLNQRVNLTALIRSDWICSRIEERWQKQVVMVFWNPLCCTWSLIFSKFLKENCLFAQNVPLSFCRRKPNSAVFESVNAPDPADHSHGSPFGPLGKAS